TAQVWQCTRVQLTARGSKHCRTRDRHGHTRTQARRRDTVLRLHLARDAPDSQRVGADSLALWKRVESAARDSRSRWRLPERRRCLSLAIGSVDVYADTRPARDLSIKRARCEWPASHCDSL